MTKPAWGGEPPRRKLPDGVVRLVGPDPVRTLAWRGSVRWRARRAGAAGWRGPETVAPVFLLTQPRTGSGLLAEHVVRVLGTGGSCGEVLHPHVPLGIPGRAFRLRPLRHVAWSLASMGPRNSVAVLHIGHLQRAGVEIDDLARRWPDARFLATYRRSLGDMFISAAVAKRTKQWSLRPGESSRRPDPFVIRPEGLTRYLDATARSFDAVLTHPVVERAGAPIAYEDLASDPSAVFERLVFPLLAIAPVPVDPPQRRRQRDYELDDVVTNLDEVRDLLATTYDPPGR